MSSLMLTQTRYLWLMVSLVIALPFSPDVQAEEHAELKQEMIRQWTKRQQLVKTLKADWNSIDFNVVPADDPDDEPEVLNRQSRITFSIGPQGKARVEYGPSDKAAAVPARTDPMISAFDGEWNYYYSEDPDPQSPDRGIVKKMEAFDEAASLHLATWLMHVRPLDKPYPDLLGDSIEIGNLDVEIDGHKCIEIKRTARKAAGPAILWVDAKHNFVVRRVHFLNNEGAVAATLDIKYRDDPQLGQIPTSWTGGFTSGAFRDFGTLNSYELNPELPESTFKIDFPPGTKYFNQDTMEQKIIPEPEEAGEKERCLNPSANIPKR